MNNEVFHLLSGGVAQRLDAAEVRCVGLHQVRIELMVADNWAKAITHLRSAVVPIDWLRRQLLRLWGRLRWFGEGPDFLNGTDADPVSLTEGTIDGSRFGHTHFGAVDKKRTFRYRRVIWRFLCPISFIRAGRPIPQLSSSVAQVRSEERRVGKECRSRGSPHH